MNFDDPAEKILAHSRAMLAEILILRILLDTIANELEKMGRSPQLVALIRETRRKTEFPPVESYDTPKTIN